jgi:HIRAN domain
VGFLDYFRSRSPQALTPLGIHLEEHSYDKESESGDPLHGYGYALRDEHDRAFSWDDEVLASQGVDVVKVAGTSHRLKAIQSDDFAPGSRLTLKPDPTNEYDRNAVGVYDGSGRVQAGFVPAEQSEDFSRRVRRERLDAFVLWAWRDKSGKRCGLRMIVGPSGFLAEPPRPLRSR